LFILQVIHEHGEPWWCDIGRGKLLIRSPELSGNPTSSHLVAKQEELAKEMMNLAYETSLSYFEGFFNMSLTWGLRLYFHSEGRHAADFYYPFESFALAWV
jgi:hypothetical protein